MKKFLVFFLVFVSCIQADPSEEEIQELIDEAVEEAISTTTTTTLLTTTTTTFIASEELKYRGIFPWDENGRKTSTIQQVTLPIDQGVIKNIDISPKESVRDYAIIYPQIEDHSSQNCYDTINEEIKNTVTLYVERDFEGEAFRKELKEEEYDPGGYTFYSWLYLEYEIIEASNEVFSAFFYWDSYGAGAAHPISDPFSINYDIRNCQKIDFNKFFDENNWAGFEGYSLYKQIVEIEVLRQLCAVDGEVKLPINNCEYDELLLSFYEWRFGEDRSEKWNIFDSSSTSFALGQYGIFVQFWEYDFYYASGDELILLPWYNLSYALDPNSIYSEILKIYSQRKELATIYEPEWDF